MASRMDRYYSKNTVTNKRSQRNEQLYHDIYNNVNYSNIEAVATLDKGNEIDINKVKEMLQNRENNSHVKNTKEYIQKPLSSYDEEIDEEKSYDIRDILNKAKEQKTFKNEYHTIKQEQYDIFKDLRDKRRREIEKEGSTEQNLRTLIDTITSTSELNKMEDRELSLDLLDDLKSNDDTIMTTRDSIKSIIAEAKKEEKKEIKPEIDQSFYTSSLGFKEEDFEQLADLNTNIKKNNVLIKILLFIILAAATIGIIILIFNILK